MKKFFIFILLSGLFLCFSQHAYAKIVFASKGRLGSDNFDIWLMNDDGTLVRLTNAPADERCPHFSPDGSKVAYTRYGDGIRIIDLETMEDYHVPNTNGGAGSNLGARPRPDIVRDWGPCNKILFCNEEPVGMGQVWEINPDGSGRRQITFEPNGDSPHAAWSPDCSMIAFSQGIPYIGGSSKVCTAPVSYFDSTTIYDSPNNDHVLDWSPDGGWILFNRFGVGELWIVSPDGQNSAKVISTGKHSNNGVFTSDGRIVYSDHDNIYVTDLSGSEIHQLTSGPEIDTDVDIWGKVPEILPRDFALVFRPFSAFSVYCPEIIDLLENNGFIVIPFLDDAQHKRATIENFIDSLKLGIYRIVHFAGHTNQTSLVMEHYLTKGAAEERIKDLAKKYNVSAGYFSRGDKKIGPNSVGISRSGVRNFHKFNIHFPERSFAFLGGCDTAKLYYNIAKSFSAHVSSSVGFDNTVAMFVLPFVSGPIDLGIGSYKFYQNLAKGKTVEQCCNDTDKVCTSPYCEGRANYVYYGDKDLTLINPGDSSHLNFVSTCPVDLTIIDPDGLVLNKSENRIAGSSYRELDIDLDGLLDDIAYISKRKQGIYKVLITPEPNARLDEKVTARVGSPGSKVVYLEKNTKIQDISQVPYIIKSTDLGIKSEVTADLGGPYRGIPGLPIEFDASNSSSENSTIVLYEWDWDDDGVYDEETHDPIATHTWSNPYDGFVVLRVTDDVGRTALDVVAVTIVPLPGDLDGDSDIDRDDLNILLTYRNQPASACPECDIDGDGIITVLDARKLVLLCTRPRCATE